MRGRYYPTMADFEAESRLPIVPSGALFTPSGEKLSVSGAKIAATGAWDI